MLGNPSDPDTFSHLFSKPTRKAGLGHWHPHELWHFGASLMLAQGTPLRVVSDVVGHASFAITKDVYGHLMEGGQAGGVGGDLRGSAGQTRTFGSQVGSHRHRRDRLSSTTKKALDGVTPVQGPSRMCAAGGTRNPNFLICGRGQTPRQKRLALIGGGYGLAACDRVRRCCSTALLY
ncbi:tyrosine-type recombinase/integrase [Streptosporangium vulgare]|uniref:tyrosine-type recombinase/integrase n=1 Tax=Streptosporangium vulgare TaxID=46190 RepID=UPI0033728A6F